MTHHFHSGRAAGVSLEQMLALNDYENSDLFNEQEKASIAFAQEITLTPQILSREENEHAVSEATQQRLTDNFNETEIVELVMGVSVFNYMNRFNRFMEPEIDMDPPPQELQDMMGPQKG